MGFVKSLNCNSSREAKIVSHRTVPIGELTGIEQAVAFARGVPGMMLPAPGEAGPEDAFELLRFAARIQSAV
jgi:hypothetical protein